MSPVLRRIWRGGAVDDGEERLAKPSPAISAATYADLSSPTQAGPCYSGAMTAAAPDTVFAGNPLDRAGDRRNDPAWIAAQAAHPDALALTADAVGPVLEAGP
eukprot:gene37446-60746_t